MSSLKKADTLGAGSSQEQPPNCSSDRRGALLRKQRTSVSPPAHVSEASALEDARYSSSPLATQGEVPGPAWKLVRTLSCPG